MSESDRAVTVTFADPAEKERFDRLLSERPDLRAFFKAGATQADEHAVPSILRGAFGATAAEIDATLVLMQRAAAHARDTAPEGERWTDDEAFCWRLGFEASAGAAARAYLDQSAPGSAESTQAGPRPEPGDTVPVHLRFADDGERARYWCLREVPAMREAAGMGVHVARRHVVGLIQANCGRDFVWNAEAKRAEPIAWAIAEIRGLGLGLACATVGRDLDDDEAFMFRAAFDAVAADVQAETKRAHAALEKLGEGLALAMAGAAACDDGLRLLGSGRPPTIGDTPRPSSVIPARRKLRPEDFGCLPQPPRR